MHSMTHEEVEEILTRNFEDELSALHLQWRKGLTPAEVRSYELSQLTSLACELAANDEIVARMQACNSNPEGEGWDFMAAEAGVSTREFTQYETIKLIEDLNRKVFVLNDAEREILVKLYFPGPKVATR